MKALFLLSASLGFAGSVTPALGVLNAPTNVAAHTAGPATIALTWEDNETSETSYIVQRDDSGWTTLAVLPANTTHYYDRGLGLGTTHNYRVQAASSGDVSAFVETGSATTLDYQPNIVFFLADDMGYKDIVALRDEAIDGPTIYETPNLDTLVESQALTFMNTYCSGPRCVVARRSIQTGKYDWRPEAVPNNDYYVDKDGNPEGGGLWAGGTTVAGSQAGAGVPIPFDNETYGEAMQSAGYRTCFIGKYHLGESAPTLHTPTGYTFGDQPGRGPVNQGYDVSIAAGHAGAPPASYFAVLNQNAGAAPDEYTFELLDLDDTSYLLPGDAAVPASGDYLNDRLTDKAIGFIDDAISNHVTQPFHLTLAHYAVHTPMEAKVADIDYFKAKKASMAAEFANHPAGGNGLITDYTSKTRVWQDNTVYAAMMKSYDDSFGKLWAYLETTDDPRNPGKKLSETTAVIVSSDHGGKSTVPIEDNNPLRSTGRRLSMRQRHTVRVTTRTNPAGRTTTAPIQPRTIRTAKARRGSTRVDSRCP
jgi:arylsulfatase A-like enzyme